MANLNQCNFIGNVARDCELRFTPSGKAVASFTIAVNEQWTSNGEKQERTEWVKCTAWDKLAEICGKMLTKGKSVFISGRMTTNQWDDKDGNKRYTTEIVAYQMQLLSPRESRDDSVFTPQPTPLDDTIPF